ncbi:Glycogenin-2 [Coemansia sp. RSA 1199]|nr:Glycogenin-2 [Coemansia sp. RSA 1199]
MDDAGRSPNAGTAAGAERFAFVTLVTSDTYVDGALVLLHSLRRTLTPHSILCLVTPAALNENSLQRLRQHFDGVIETDLHQSTDDCNLALLGRPDLRSTLTKIKLWHPALFGAWSAICYLDADTLVRQSIDDIFSRFSAWRNDTPEWRHGGLVAAAPDTGWPDCFNSGVLLLAPGLECYQALLHRAAQSNASFDGADQGLLNEHFADWSTAKPYRRLPFLYNATANVYYTYEPALQRFGHDVRVVHFIGISKPWHWERTPGGQLISDSSPSERWRQLVSLWWSIHDEGVSGWKHWRGPFDKGIAFNQGYHHITEPVLPDTITQSAHAFGYSDTVSAPETHDQAHPSDSQVPEISDWEKDWTWAADRVHPLDYAYLVTHAKPTHESAPADLVRHPLPEQNYENAQTEHQSNSWQPLSEQRPEHIHTQSEQDGRRDHDIEARQDNSVHHSQATEQHRSPNPCQHDSEPPVWMQSQRPWEDVAREGWLHHEEYKPHSYDQSYIQRHVNTVPSAEPHTQHHHEHHHEQEQHWDHHQCQAEYTPMPLPNNQPIYEAAQVVLQPRHDTHEGHHHQSHNWNQQANDHQEHHHQSHFHQDYQGGGYEHPHNQHSNVQHDRGYVEHVAVRTSEPAHHHHYESYQVDSQAQPNHAWSDYGQHGSQPHQQAAPDRHDSHSTSSSSPLYYPQPKSPMIVNPVALWESSEEQARRRAWAQHVQAPHDDVDDRGRPNRSTPWVKPVQSADERILSTAMDHIDSSTLPHDTPWKISHVRHRPVESTANEAGALPPHLGMQFKEGVANDFSARDAAGQLLKRWNEAVIARNIKLKLGDIDSENISHSVAAPEKGTDAIRLETTVSCEAEDSKGERTVYRFTLSSTLDVGGAKSVPAQPEAVLSPESVSDSQPLPAQSMSLTGNSARASAMDNAYLDRSAIVRPSIPPPDTGVASLEAELDARVLGAAVSDNRGVKAYASDYTNVTDLLQPENYHEPAMSRRSSFVQLQRNAARAPHMAMRSNHDNADQFAESDARYWKLQRQLIDLEMSQQHHESQARGTANTELKDSAAGNAGGMIGQRHEKLDLASPPTPSHQLPTAQQNGLGHALRRRPSAFSVADPTAIMQGTATMDAQPVAATSTVLPSTGINQPSRRRSQSSPRLTVDTSQPASGVAVKPSGNEPISYAKRSRSQSTLRRIAAENSAQVVVQSPKPQAQLKHTARPVFITSSPDGSGSDSDGDDDTASNALDGESFKPASSRMPTPFPRGLRKTSTTSEQGNTPSKDVDSGDAEERVSRQRDDADSVRASPGSAGFGSANFGMPIDAVGGEVSPGQQKIKPTINWGDDDDDLLPPENDRSLDAQWRRIVFSAPPARVQAVPLATKAAQSGIKQPTKPASEKVMPSADNTKPISASKSGVDIDGSSVKIAASAIDSPSSGAEASLSQNPGGDTEKELAMLKHVPLDVQPPKPTGGTRAPPRKLHSTKSFLNLTSQTFDALSDSDEDPGEAALERRFWERAMKPSKSGISTPYSPGRRKSVTEMSSLISPRDLEEWMKWQGDNSSAPDYDSADEEPATGDEVSKQPEDLQQELITPPVSKSSGAPDLNVVPTLGCEPSSPVAEAQDEVADDDNSPVVSLVSDDSTTNATNSSDSTDTHSQPVQLPIS